MVPGRSPGAKLRNVLPPAPSGRVNVQLLVTVLALMAVVFGVVRILPAYTDDLDVKQAMASVLIFAATRSDDQLRTELQEKLQNIGTHVAYDGWGNNLVVPGLVFGERELLIERDDVRHLIRMEVTYERVVDLHPLPKKVTLSFHDFKEGPLSR